ncbi:hydrogenase large subunit [Pyrococcus abyssi]|uniref:Hydrogenase 4, component G or formate hydrogen lyase, subunit 5 n=1 Tax=Pyrococcus abyssi (strain GE5 / Orsay) TaxID=272844 RepID=Q9UYN4_PYRAB|nr:hydrogenase large subunit [Pyrococcus abyssi]CAB50378.1 Hydrogenase 4, component G or formate hydrogen lyase, subunit 5 [Pyrococcus abyssi GE5]CCE70925.1 TPA: hydrogenase-4 component g [Pyrococcus abyssi GE5]
MECKACEKGKCRNANLEEVLSEREGLLEFYEEFKEHIHECKRMSYGQYMFVIDKEVLPKAVLWWHNHPKFKETHLSTAVGTDETPLNGKFAYMPFLSVQVEPFNMDRNYWVFLKAYLDPENPEFPSVAAELPAALWIEREVQDLLGFKAINHPDPRRLVLPEDWPDGVYPLRKCMDYRYSPMAEPKIELKKPPEGTSTVPMGPLHMGIEEPAHFKLFVKGEEIVDVDYRGFYSHRGIEKIGEGRLTYNQVLFLAERICGICGYQHSVSYAMAIERLADVEIPDRARYIRTLLLELERIHNHLLWVGIAAHLVGYDTGFMHAWRIREPVMWLMERLTGNRKQYGMNIVGGVRRDILDYRKEEILRVVREIREEVKRFLEVVLNTNTFIKRAEGVGILPYKVAKEFSVLGPTARASGRKIDARLDQATKTATAYNELDWKVPVYKEGDVLARVLVRMDELFESIWIVEQVIDQMPGGDVMVPVGRLPEYEEALGFTEAHRGEVVHYVMTGEKNKVYRWKVRAPTYNNLPAVPEMLKGYHVADAPLIIASIDPCYSCTERVQIVDVRSGKVKVLTESEFNELSIKRSKEMV